MTREKQKAHQRLADKLILEVQVDLLNKVIRELRRIQEIGATPSNQVSKKDKELYLRWEQMGKEVDAWLLMRIEEIQQSKKPW